MEITHNSSVFSHRPKSAVAIAASAGGLTAIEELLENIAPSTDACFFVLLHLASDKGSALIKRLAAKTSMSVQMMSDGILTFPNTVYILPPAHVARLVDGEILLSAAPEAIRAYPIDAFCSSLAEQKDTNSCAVFLSGVGEDGCLGASKMKTSGKEIIVQSPKTARFASLPERIIEICGEVHAVLPPKDLAVWLSTAVNTESANQLLPEHFLQSNKPISSEPHVLRGINAELHERIALLEEKVSYLQTIKSAQPGSSVASKSVRPLSILIVDDNSSDRALLRTLLDEIAGEQYEVSEASTAGKAMQMLTENGYDLCLLDYNLDDITASGLLDALPDSAAQTSFVVISGLLDLAITDCQLNSDAVPVLDKNRLTLDVLRNSIQNALQTQKRRESLADTQTALT